MRVIQYYINSFHKVWVVNGFRHREDGPAIIYSSGHKYWYRNGIQVQRYVVK